MTTAARTWCATGATFAFANQPEVGFVVSLFNCNQEKFFNQNLLASCYELKSYGKPRVSSKGDGYSGCGSTGGLYALNDKIEHHLCYIFISKHERNAWFEIEFEGLVTLHQVTVHVPSGGNRFHVGLHVGNDPSERWIPTSNQQCAYVEDQGYGPYVMPCEPHLTGKYITLQNQDEEKEQLKIVELDICGRFEGDNIHSFLIARWWQFVLQISVTPLQSAAAALTMTIGSLHQRNFLQLQRHPRPGPLLQFWLPRLCIQVSIKVWICIVLSDIQKVQMMSVDLTVPLVTMESLFLLTTHGDSIPTT